MTSWKTFWRRIIRAGERKIEIGHSIVTVERDYSKRTAHRVIIDPGRGFDFGGDAFFVTPDKAREIARALFMAADQAETRGVPMTPSPPTPEHSRPCCDSRAPGRD